MPKLRLTNVTTKLNETAQAELRLISSGDIVAISFSINYDPSVIEFDSIDLVNAPDGVVVNTNIETPGQIGVLIDGVNPHAKTRSYKTIANVTFNAVKVGKTALAFTNIPVDCNTANVKGVLLTTSFYNGKVTVKK